MIFTSIIADPTIVTILKPPPPSVLKSIPEDDIRLLEYKSKKLDLKTPNKISKTLLKASFNKASFNNYIKLDGFLALYHGYSTFSNRDGMITFPIRHKPDTKVILTITPKIELSKIDGNTFARLKSQDAEVYIYEKKTDENKRIYWNVSRKAHSQETRSTETINETGFNETGFNETGFNGTGFIDATSIVILSKPKNIFIQQGDFISRKDKNIVLPQNIYVLANNSNTKELLNFMTISRFFEPISYKEKLIKEKLREQKIIQNA